MLHNRGKGVGKQVLAMWMSGGLQRALRPENTKAGFCATSMWPLDPHATDQHLGPATPFSVLSRIGNVRTACEKAWDAYGERRAIHFGTIPSAREGRGSLLVRLRRAPNSKSKLSSSTTCSDAEERGGNNAR